MIEVSGGRNGLIKGDIVSKAAVAAVKEQQSGALNLVANTIYKGHAVIT